MRVDQVAVIGLFIPVRRNPCIQLRNLLIEQVDILLNLFNDMLRGADCSGNTQPLKIKACKIAIHFFNLLPRGKIHTPILFCIARTGDKQHIGIIRIGEQLLRGFLRHVAKTHLNKLAGKQIV